MTADAAKPGSVGEDGSLELRNVVFAGSNEVFNIRIEDGHIAAISPSGDAAEYLCIPPLADLHVHANRAFTRPELRPRGLEDAVRNVARVFDAFSEEDYRRHAGLLIGAAYRHGTTRIRTHADIDASLELEAVAGSLRAGEEWSDRVDVQVVAFAASNCDPATADGREVLRSAIRLGAHYLGAAPAFCADQAASIDGILDLALELSVPVDLHLDEHLDPRRCFSEYLASAVIERGLEGRVTLSHACAVSSLTKGDRSRVIDKLAEAEITVIALPRTNLYLQDAGEHTPTLRGIAPVREMVAAGIQVRLASDNVQDAFYPYGDADLLGVAMDGILAARLDEPRALVFAVCDGRHAFSEGDSVDMVLLPGTRFDDVLADLPAQRWLVRSGVVTRAGD